MTNQSPDEFIHWCRQQRVDTARNLNLLENGVVTLHADGMDITESQIERLRRVIEELDKIIAAQSPR